MCRSSAGRADPGVNRRNPLARLLLPCFPEEPLRPELKQGGSRERVGPPMKHKNSHLLVGYWSRLRKGRDLPDQCDVDPRAIKRMLSQIFILDATDSDHPIYRLAGTTLCQRFGMELKAANFLTHWESKSRSALTLLLRQSLRMRQPVCLSATATTAECGMVELETILAPITFGPGEPTRFIGMMQVLSDPFVLAGRPIAFQRLIASSLVREDEPLAGFEIPPPSPPPLEAIRTHPKAPHLRLVVSREKSATVHMDVDDALKRIFSLLGASPATAS